jgi:hypothetical protein
MKATIDLCILLFALNWGIASRGVGWSVSNPDGVPTNYPGRYLVGGVVEALPVLPHSELWGNPRSSALDRAVAVSRHRLLLGGVAFVARGVLT